MSRPLVSRVGPLGRAFSAFLLWLLSRLPRTRVEGLAALIAGLAWRLGIRRAITLDNLSHALPELPDAERTRIARAAYRNMGLAALEGFGAARLTDGDVERRVRVENFEAMEAAVLAGKGVLVATAHFGSWELLGSVMARRGLRVSAVVRPLSGAFNARIVEARRKNGMNLIPPRGALMGAVKALRKGDVVVMLLDQVLPARHGVFVPFFGRATCTNPALATAAMRTGSPVFVVMGVREGDTLRMSCEGPFPLERTANPKADIIAHTATVTAVLERYIRAYPEQWLWMHRRWKVQPP